MNIKDQIRAEIERLKSLHSPIPFCDNYEVGYSDGYQDCCDSILAFLDALPEQPVEYPTSTEMIAEWENNELPMLREKDFRGDAERMAYSAFMDGFAKGLGYKK